VAGAAGPLASEALLDLLDPGLERSHMLLQLCEVALEDLAPAALVGKSRLDPAQGLRARVVLLLESLESAVDLIEVPEYLLSQLGEAEVYLVEPAVDFAEPLVDLAELAVDLGELTAQEFDELLVLDGSHGPYLSQVQALFKCAQLGTAVSAIAVALASIGALFILAAETGGEHVLGISAEQSRVTVLFALYSICAAPVVEEVIFRGYLVIENRGRLLLWAGVVGVSLLFAALHPLPVEMERSRPHAPFRRQALVQHGDGLRSVALVLHRTLLSTESAAVVDSLLRRARHEERGRLCDQVRPGLRGRLVITGRLSRIAASQRGHFRA
jgi:Type II CAAX prenyl endopeptidase Rce1-like